MRDMRTMNQQPQIVETTQQLAGGVVKRVKVDLTRNSRTLVSLTDSHPAAPAVVETTSTVVTSYQEPKQVPSC